MRDEYDFSGAVRGRFFSRELSPPIHLDPTLFRQLKNRADREGRSLDALVNELLRAATTDKDGDTDPHDPR